MTRLQSIALLVGSCCVLLIAGLTWRAYAPDGVPPKLPFANVELSPDTEANRETPKTQPPQAKVEKSSESSAPQKTIEMAALPPVSRLETTVVPPEPQTSDKAPVSHPEFDVVRVEPTGEAVIAGRGHAKTKVQLMAGNKVLAEAMTDAMGQFVVTPTLPPGSYELTLREGQVASLQSVTVSVARKPDEKTFAVLAEPNKPAVVLTPPSPIDKSRDGVAFLTAEVDKNAFYATGTAEPHARVRLYADEKALADVTAGADGRWSLRLEKKLTAGRHKLRADRVDPAGKVLARAEIPFEAPAEIVEGKAEIAQPQTDLPADAAKGTAVVVQRGHTLWSISRQLLGSGMRYTEIYEANTGQIRNPHLIYPGQVFVVPHVEH
jgi:LysM repeat protein